ncbi:MAG: XRE family transcriptional regulator [Desulfovibrionaceae bacterium]|nr:XRE family transcriptional regulator [Desulfovibrionaceae bacterium]
MCMSYSLTPMTLSRQEQFMVWMQRNKVTFKMIAEYIGVNPVSAGRLCRAEHAPSLRVLQLAAMGIPRALLPSPLDIPPGPKPKHRKKKNTA